ncbi:MAG: adenylate/guanylate cyclase domain-containing protein, partial [Proteobacteria bacterium]|nr:adenylate/guanylate cyclase domain-containing protein [Pseudomonadota bacterium]
MTGPATAAGIAAIRRRYLLMAVSAGFVDLAISLFFVVLTDNWRYAPTTLGAGLLLQVGLNYLLSARLFAPLDRFLRGAARFEDIEERLTQLPILTARNVGLIALVLTVFRLGLGFVSPGVPPITIPDFVTLCLVMPAFYFTYAYFVVSDYLAKLCAFIFRHYGNSLGLFYGRYRTKLIVALVVISVAPLAAIVVDLYSYEGDRLKMEIANDVVVAAFGMALASFFIARSLLRPIRILSRGMAKVAEGDLALRLPVTSNDEIGELTGRFNDMIEGLRERERIRETFGRYVDESVAATILAREGDGVLAGEQREATILFTDIAGFTTIAEALAPDELVAALNAYLETVLEPIGRHGGVVNSFTGDGLFASFNLPLPCDDHAAAAVRAAIDIQRAVGSRVFGDLGLAFETRIGI